MAPGVGGGPIAEAGRGQAEMPEMMGPDGMPGAPNPVPSPPERDFENGLLGKSGGPMAEIGRTRRLFPETWLWTESEMG